MARTFYVDALNGSDNNDGTSTNSAFASLDKVNNLGLQPGDTVLFARGSTFDGSLSVNASGTADAPITFGAYGTGADPVITNTEHGVLGNGQDNIVLQNLHISGVSGAGIITSDSQGWTIDHLAIDHTGSAHVEGNSDFSAIQFWHGSGLTVSNSTMSNIEGDAMFLWDVSGVKILQNHIDVPTGPNADNIHSYQMSDYEIRGNVLSFEGETNSGKGNMVVQESKNGVIADNTFILSGNAHYGIGGTIENGVIENNHFIGRAEGTWSTALNITETLGQPSSVSNTTIHGNFFDGTGMGIYAWDWNGAGTAYRSGFEVTGNIFKDLRDPAIVAEGDLQLNGSFSDNTLINTADPNWGGAAGSLSVENNVHTSDMPAWTGGADSYVPVQVIAGTDGNDTLTGTDGADTIWGDVRQDGPAGGNDVLNGGAGNDYLSGGPGSDIYVGAHGGGFDTIRWFEAGQDKIDVSAFGWKSLDEMQAAGAVLTPGAETDGTPFVTVDLGGGDGFKAYGVGALTGADFHFAGSNPTDPLTSIVAKLTPEQVVF